MTSGKNVSTTGTLTIFVFHFTLPRSCKNSHSVNRDRRLLLDRFLVLCFFQLDNPGWQAPRSEIHSKLITSRVRSLSLTSATIPLPRDLRGFGYRADRAGLRERGIDRNE